METILITGGTGLIGKRLTQILEKKGYSVRILSSRHSTNKSSFYWNIDTQEIEEGCLTSIDHIIHLAGANIGEKRWTKKQRQLLIDSRVRSTSLLFNTIKNQSHKPLTFVSASAIGIYGAVTVDHIFNETDNAASDFLGSVGLKWEESAQAFEELGIRVVKIRTGIVLSPQGGVLAKMIKPISLYAGAIIGNGRQYFPWIHIDDLCEIYCKAIQDSSMVGAFNAVAPQHINNKDFTIQLCRKLKKPLLLPAIPAIVFKIAWGEMSQLILKGSRISSQKIIDSGFTFSFPTIESAFHDIIT